MRKLLESLLRKPDQSSDWTISRMRALEEQKIGPRYPTGLFTIYNPHDKSVVAQ
jgi:hypothetical protein